MPQIDIDKIIHTRFARLFLDHRAELKIGDKTDAEIVEQTGGIFLALMDVIVAAVRQGDHAKLDKLDWFTRACADEIDEKARARLDG